MAHAVLNVQERSVERAHPIHGGPPITGKGLAVVGSVAGSQRTPDRRRGRRLRGTLTPWPLVRTPASVAGDSRRQARHPRPAGRREGDASGAPVAPLRG